MATPLPPSISLSEIEGLDRASLDALLKSRGVKLGPRLRLVNELASKATETVDVSAPPSQSVESGVSKHSQPPASPDTLGELEDMSEEQCEAVLEELLAAYRQPAFVAALQELNAQPGSGVQNVEGRIMARVGPSTDATYGAKLGALVLSAQRPVLRRYGLPADASGVARMKQAVHRRRVEQEARGASRLHELSQQARMVLGLTSLRDMREFESAEDMYHKSVMGTIVGGGGVNGLSGDEASMRQQLRTNVERMCTSGAISAGHAAFLLRTLADAAVTVLGVRTLLRMAETGVPCHAIAGSDVAANPRAYLGPVTVLSAVPSAEAFWREYVLPGRPLVLRGVLRDSGWAPARTFGSFEYLRSRCGHRRVLVKSLGKEDQDGRRIFVSDPELKLPLVEFLKMVEKCESDETPCPFYLGKVPLKAELPELHADLEAHKGASPIEPLMTHAFGPLIPQGVFTYFGCGRQVSSTHFDPNENLLVVLQGTKRLWLYPPSDGPNLCPVPTADGSRAAAPPFQKVEALPEHMRAAFMDVTRARGPVEVRLEAGDAFYLPCCWWHCVEGSMERNMILNWWCSVHPQKRAYEGTPPDEPIEAS